MAEPGMCMSGPPATCGDDGSGQPQLGAGAAAAAPEAEPLVAGDGRAPRRGRLTTPDGLVLPAVCGGHRLSRPQTMLIAAGFIIAGGFLLGGLLPMHTDDPAPYDRISSVIGWIYFFAWSVSFYPQVYFNWVRRSVEGMSFDFVLLNAVGFACYSAYNVTYYWVGSVQDEYRQRHNKDNVVRANDVFFALHAEFITLVTLAQIFIFERGQQRFHWAPIAAMCAAAVVFTVWAVCISQDVNDNGSPFKWLDWFLGLSYLKLGISIVKYVPQVYLNWLRKSTTGWNIWNVLLDFTGGTMSVGQLLMDCAAQNDWSGIAGDPVKFGLGFCSMFFDIIFMVQHYCLYAENNRAIQLREDSDDYNYDVYNKSGLQSPGAQSRHSEAHSWHSDCFNKSP